MSPAEMVKHLEAIEAEVARRCGLDPSVIDSARQALQMHLVELAQTER